VAEGIPAAAARGRDIAAKSTAPADLPSAPTGAPGATTSAQAQPGVPAPPGPDKEPAAAGRTVTIATDSYRAEIDTTGGVIAQVALLKHRDPATRRSLTWH
jgi:YidC/Oxa1 family membrane protein insertase